MLMWQVIFDCSAPHFCKWSNSRLLSPGRGINGHDHIHTQHLASQSVTAVPYLLKPPQRKSSKQTGFLIDKLQ